MNILELNHIDKDYKLDGGELYHALKDINVSFKKGELVSIIGESGSGKSTLMNVIGGLDSDYTGKLLFNGENIGEYSEKQLDEYRKNKIGFIFQSFNLIPHLSILDNVTIAMTLSNVSKEERVKRAEEILEQLGLKQHIHKKPNQLSGGQKQRVAIARALINDPDIIIADEPTGALDSETTDQVLKIIEDIAKRGKLVIMVTHSDKVAAHSSRVIRIADGEIIYDRKGRELAHIEETTETSNISKRAQNLSFVSAVKLAFQNMREKMNRNIWVSLGASIGIMSVILMLSLGGGLKAYINHSINNMANPRVVEVNMDEHTDNSADSSKGMNTLLGQSPPFTNKDLETLTKIDHVDSVEKSTNIIGFGTNTISYGDKSTSVLSLSTMSSNVTDSALLKGSFPGKNEIVIQEETADALGGDVIGKTITFKWLVDEKFYSADFVVSGIANNTYVNYKDLAQVYADNGNELQPTTVYLVADDKSHTAAIKEEIEKSGYRGSAQEAMTDSFNGMIDALTIVLASISGISLFVSAIMILVILHISVVERTKEIGVLKAIGARRKDIKRIFVSEAFLIGLFSGLIAVTLTSVLGWGANSISSHMFDMNIVQMKMSYITFGIVTSISISMLAGLLPASKAAKLEPVDSLRRE
ncbi:ABC transporter ATP-binding protein/permease [Priestia aryabhattai]|uniref:ABC transporter ATP-binding protein/permease n=1 Tax=Priestia aryabhattai TaxID=412384 RepID=UPI00203F2DD1|nr:ABC transporter ATP-binding protein/permease [Priestia aryabhattai]MCM3255709.1 ATP-binding cassette domain-containing protein [Priestia aryabhattai]